MIPADLLSALREKDPALFRGVIGGFPLKNGKYLSILDMEPPAALAWFQHCLQEAIRARRWSHTLDCVPEGPNRCGACVIFGPQFHNRCIRNGDTEAEALLRAYLAAIREAHV